jgi:polar amino acid transport system substrate-binding protein
MTSGRCHSWRRKVRALCWTLLWGCSWASAQSVPEQLRSGWYMRPPYQMEASAAVGHGVTGLDIQVARELFASAGYRTRFDAMTWHTMLAGLKSGEVDMVMGAYYDESRETFAYHSQPYRVEHNALYYHREMAALGEPRNVTALIELLKKQPFRVAVTEDYVYGSPEFMELIRDPPPLLELVQANDYEAHIRLIMEREIDFFVSNPIIMDRLLADWRVGSLIRRSSIDMGELPIHILFSKATMTPAQVAAIDGHLQELIQKGRIRALHIDYVLPVYLSITTGQTWFVMLNILGIIAFCTSAVILARRERYNLFGALVLATLPAIGGGVLRDLLLGAERVYILESPVYLLIALTVVVVSFIGFRVYDWVHGLSHNVAGRLQQYAEGQFSTLMDQLFKVFDAWAVASFTIIGVSVAVEMQAEPLWLWGPAMGVLTASGGVVLRDMVRADFNIEMLKRDSFAEISILGGFLYTFLLMRMPYALDIDILFYRTLGLIVFLFGIRFLILWRGYDNPLQFGAMHTRPETRLAEFEEKEGALWEPLRRYFQESTEGKAQPTALDDLDEIRNQFLFEAGDIRQLLDSVAAEPLSEAAVRQYRNSTARLDIIVGIEVALHDVIRHPGITGATASPAALELRQAICESVKALIEMATWAVESKATTDFDLLNTLTSQHQQRFNELRGRYGQQITGKDRTDLELVLNVTHKVERVIFLLADYAQLHRTIDTRPYAANRRTAQALINQNT